MRQPPVLFFVVELGFAVMLIFIDIMRIYANNAFVDIMRIYANNANDANI